MEQIRPELKDFIIDFCKKNKIKRTDLDNLNLDTSLDLDLNIFDDDMDLFLTEFVNRFKIDYSNFSWEKYGYPTSSALVGIIKGIFGYRKKWVKRVANFLYTPKLKVQELQKAIESGTLL
ncbi:MAG TPA: DUF1493 family protein [Chitinophaga sp.]|uniref:DUF1493 family protein n=1 Tax=Chitinophaga sp. TaxID=1869181 RepID=UPI002CE09D04|nr:DUF1493 family protein [Chitinophaga sp.]HVI49019.1 DUF1493 family protein [Chitinophaga sp.]